MDNAPKQLESLTETEEAAGMSIDMKTRYSPFQDDSMEEKYLRCSGLSISVPQSLLQD